MRCCYSPRDSVHTHESCTAGTLRAGYAALQELLPATIAIRKQDLIYVLGLYTNITSIETNDEYTAVHRASI